MNIPKPTYDLAGTAPCSPDQWDSLQKVADHVLGPTNLPPFDLPDQDGKAVFIDISKAQYNLFVDMDRKVVRIEATLKFKNLQSGFPLLDLVPGNHNIEIDGQTAHLHEAALPCDSTTMKYVDSKVEPGEHEVKITYEFAYPLVYGTKNKISTGDLENDLFFGLSDLNDRGYLESD